VSSKNDQPPQPQPIQQQPSRSFKPRIWKAFFILLLIANLIFFGPLIVALPYHYEPGPGILAGIPFILLLSFIDFIAIISYLRNQHPHGIAEVISYIALIASGLVLIYFGLMLVLSGIAWVVFYFIKAAI
jgi:hypothetical protein